MRKGAKAKNQSNKIISQTMNFKMREKNPKKYEQKKKYTESRHATRARLKKKRLLKVQASKPSTISYRYTLDQLSDLIGLTHRKLKLKSRDRYNVE